MKLSELPPGGRGTVRENRCGEPLLGRLLDLGLSPGTETECLHAAPAGSPRAYRVRGAAIAIRTEDAEKILLEDPRP